MQPSLLSPDFADALHFAATLHSHQIRKGSGVPYISHLISVCAIVIENGGTEDEAIAALLHDAIEDQSEHHGGAAVLRERILRRYGANVLAIVEGCTDADTFPKPEWRERKERFVAHIARAPEPVCLVVAADKLHNVRTIVSDLRSRGDELWSIFNKPKAETMWYIHAMTDALDARLVTRGRAIIDELHALERGIEGLN